jgi:hypothetical protein
MVRFPHRTVADWTPDDGDVDAWLASWGDTGGVPEYPWGGVEIDSHHLLHDRGTRMPRWVHIC